MKAYYHEHESEYQKIEARGGIGWGNAKILSELGDPLTKEYLQKSVEKFFGRPIGKTALDVGCGTGTTAFLLSNLGFDVTGVDVSETAVRMARSLATQENLKIEFIVGDVLDLDRIEHKFDLVYDSHCLHCIVYEDERQKVLAGVRHVLAADGIFILDTMVVPSDHFDPTGSSTALYFDSDFILWHRTAATSGRGILERDGKNWCAQRRIYPVGIIRDEVTRAGFKILHEQIDQQPKKPAMLRLVLTAQR